MGPLASLKILDFTSLLPGPFATMMLADLGAEVLRIEAPQRPDLIRLHSPFDADGETSAWHALLGRSKYGITLDLKKPEAIDIVKQLVQTYDVVVEQFRPGVMDRLGIGYEALRAVNPRLIYCAITGYGQTGPYRDRAGHDINYLALSGMMSHSGRNEQGPVPQAVQIADVGAGSYNALVGILAAVIHRAQTSEGQYVDVSMLDGSIAWNSLNIAKYLVGAEEPEAEGEWLNGGSYYDYYRTRDDRYLSVGSLEPKFWEGFCHTLGRPDLIERGYDQDSRTQHALKTEIQTTIATRTLAEWATLFAKVDVCVEPVLNVSEMIDHPQVRAREMIVDAPRADGTSLRQVGHPIKFSRTPATYKHIGAKIGAHTDEVLLKMGYTREEMGQLRKAGVFG